MPGIDGFEVIGRRTPERMPAIVFLTAYDQFALRAFDAQALDYLLKPASEERFASTIARLKRQLGNRDSRRESVIVVTTTRGSAVVPLREIDWIQAENNYSRLWTGQRSYLLREPMRALETRVGGAFVRTHRRALVRLDAVQTLLQTSAGGLPGGTALGRPSSRVSPQACGIQGIDSHALITPDIIRRATLPPGPRDWPATRG